MNTWLWHVLMKISDSLRKQLVNLARKAETRSAAWTQDSPTDWRPQTVRKPGVSADRYFTDQTAWDWIANQLESGCEVFEVELRKPRGKKGYVLESLLDPSEPPLYVKLELQSRKVIGRSFHYSYKPITRIKKL